MIEEKSAGDDFQKVFLQVESDEYLEVSLSLPLQMLFDDAINFVSKIDV